MTEKRFWCLEEYEGETSPIVDGKFAPTNGWLCNRLNELYEENEQLKQFKNKVFSCIEKAVEETEKYNHSDTSRYYSRKDLLAKLQDGLTGDVE